MLWHKLVLSNVSPNGSKCSCKALDRQSEVSITMDNEGGDLLGDCVLTFKG